MIACSAVESATALAERRGFPFDVGDSGSETK